jgi:transposase-like protein
MPTATLTPRGRQMQTVLARWERSGLTLAEFARREGMPASTLAWWRYQLRQRTGTGRADAPVAATAFTEVQRECAAAAPAFVEIVLRNGRVVRVPLGGVELTALRTLLRALDEPC